MTALDTSHEDYGGIKRYIRTAPGVTTSIMDNGVVLIYFKVGAGTTNPPRTLPITIVQSGTFYLGYWLATGRIFYFTKIFGTTNGWNVNSSAETRYVIIPGGVAGGRFTTGPAAGYTVEQIKAMSYEQVKALFNIPENGSNEK